jgi:pimeloyl-ACP methyl ester carboxylesterase
VASDELTRRWLLEHGMALAASNYRTPAGVVFAEPLEDQVALLDWVDAHLGRPRQVITWGNSGGGVLATLLAERHPDRIDGAIPLCGPLGGIGTQFNLTLDFAFAVRTLLAPGSDLELVRITDPDATAARAAEIVQGALGTPQAAPGSRSPTPWPTWMAGSATFTIATSRTTMNCAGATQGQDQRLFRATDSHRLPPLFWSYFWGSTTEYG